MSEINCAEPSKFSRVAMCFDSMAPRMIQKWMHVMNYPFVPLCTFVLAGLFAIHFKVEGDIAGAQAFLHGITYWMSVVVLLFMIATSLFLRESIYYMRILFFYTPILFLILFLMDSSIDFLFQSFA